MIRHHAGRPALAFAVAAAAACSDPNAPPAVDPKAPVVTLGALPAGDTLPQRAFEVSISLSGQGSANNIEVITDPGTPAERVTSLVGGYAYFSGIPVSGGTSFTVWLPHPLPDGPHTIDIRVTGDSGHANTVRFSRVFSTPAAAYTATVLPGIGGDTAYAYGLNAKGDVAGYVAGAAGKLRPVVWRNAQPTVLPDTSAKGARAVRINDVGDVLGDVPGARYDGTTSFAQVWRADGRGVAVGPVAVDTPYVPKGTRCCNVAVDLSDARVAMAYGPYGVVLLDVASGATQLVYASTNLYPVGINDRGQAVGTQILLGSSDGTGWWTSGPALDIREASYARCSHPHYSARALYAVGNGGEVVASNTGCVAALSIPGEAPLTVDQALAPGTLTTVRMNRQGTILAGLDATDSTLYVWRRSERRTVRVRLNDGAWKIDALEGVNATGAIVAHGVDAASRRSAALLLTPATSETR